MTTSGMNVNGYEHRDSLFVFSLFFFLIIFLTRSIRLYCSVALQSTRTPLMRVLMYLV